MLLDIRYLFPTNYLSSYFSHQETNKSPFEDVDTLNELAQTLTSVDCDLDQWMTWKNDIKTFISEHAEDLEQLDQFFTTITEWGVERNPQKIRTIFADIVSPEIMSNTVRAKQKNSSIPFDNIFELAYENASFCPSPIDASFKAGIQAEWKTLPRRTLHVLTNTINIFLGAFNFLDSQKKFTTLWEKHLLLEIIYKFFVIPYCLVKILQPMFVVTAKVYLVAALIIAGTGILISCYQRWLRPLPDEIVNCTNLDKQMEQGLIESKVGQEMEMGRLIAALEVDANVLLIAPSGEGKTSLMHHFIRLKHNGELSEKLQKLTVHEVDCGLMISSVSFGHAELINQIKEQTAGHDHEVLLFFDDFDQVATNVAAFLAFKKRILEDKPHSKFVATISLTQFQKLKKLDADGSFQRRVVPIFVQSSSDEQIRLMILDHINRVAQDMPVTDDAIEAILEISAQEDYLPGIGRPAKAIKILMDAIGLCRAGYNLHYVSAELSQARQDYQVLQLQAKHHVKVCPDQLKKLREAKAQIEAFEKDLNQSKRQVQKVKKIIDSQQKMNSDYYHLTHLFAQAVAVKPTDDILEKRMHLDDLEDIFDETQDHLTADVSPKAKIAKESISEHDQILYQWDYFYGLDAMKKRLQREIEEVNDQIPIQVDANLIYQAYEASKSLEEDLFDDMDDEKSEDKKKDSLTRTDSRTLKRTLQVNKEEIKEENKDPENEPLLEFSPKTLPLDMTKDDLYET